MRSYERIRGSTRLEPVPFVAEIRLYTATELTPLWRATAEWLDAEDVSVPFWCVPWAGGQALARWVLDHPEAVRGRRVVDVGTGAGLVAIAAKLAGAASVRALDVDPLACAACELNAEANGVALEIVRADASTDLDATVGAEIVLAGDVWYERETAERLGAWMLGLAARGARVLTGDPGRSYAPEDARVLAEYDIPTEIELESATSKRTRVLELGAR